MWRESKRFDDIDPSYLVEHLATFGVGPQFGLQWPVDGIRKLKQMERSSAVWAQKMILKLTPDAIVLVDENGDMVEQFPLRLVSEPSAHLSTDWRDVYNNLLVFVVDEDKRHNRSPTEMHIFHCVRVSAKDVAEDIGHYLRGRFGTLKRGKQRQQEEVGFKGNNSYITSTSTDFFGPSFNVAESRASNGTAAGGGRFVSNRVSSDTNYESDGFGMGFEKDVNSLNRCFDDVERFVARIQTAALAQRDLDALQKRRDSKAPKSRSPHEAALQARAQLPSEQEFVDVFKKFKHCFNILAKLRSHIHEPNAPELLHFLFTPFAVILDACRWGLGRDIAGRVVSPLLTRDAVSLLQHSLTSKEYEVWTSLGESWTTPSQDWNGPAPAPFVPSFLNGFASSSVFAEQGRPPKGRNGDFGAHSAINIPIERPKDPQRSVDDSRLAEKERLLNERELRLSKLQKELKEEQLKIRDAMDRISLTTPERDASNYPPTTMTTTKNVHRSNSQFRDSTFAQQSQNSPNLESGSVDPSPRQRAFLDNLKAKRAKVAKVTYDRIGQNSKELTVSKDEYLEVINDTKNWWECRNIYNRIGFVPNTILHPIYDDSVAAKHGFEEPISVRVPGHGSPSSGPPSASAYRNTYAERNGFGARDRREWSSYSDQAANETRTTTANRRNDYPY